MGPLLQDITVNGEVIPAAAIAAEAQMHAAPKDKPGIAWRAAGRALTVRALLLQEARRRGLTPQPQHDNAWTETEEEALIRQLLEVALVPELPGDEALRAIYDADPGRWRAPRLYEAAHILFAAAPGDSEARARAKEATAVARAELARNPASFDHLARSLSACSSRDAGGRLGQISAGDTVPEFESALDCLEEGQIAPTPVETRYGFHIIRLDARAEGAVLPFEAVAGRLREAAAKRAWADAARRFTATLAAEASVTGIDLVAA
ncbi:MAG: peptidylprolyl isomerase [Rhodobacteraceae bacterium]|nr:peptidylprolyl isomerase [Paracoccaceae bacterium]